MFNRGLLLLCDPISVFLAKIFLIPCSYIAFRLRGDLKSKSVLLYPFYRLIDWDTERESNLIQVTC